MPPRFLTLAIVALWLVVLGWFACWDVWPRLNPGEQPYRIDLAREVTRPNSPRHWNVFHNGVKVGHAESWVMHHAAADTYELHNRYHFQHFHIPLLKAPLPISVEVRSLDTRQFVSRDGNLRAVKVDADGSVPVLVGEFALHVKGQVEDGKFTSHWKIDIPPASREVTPEPITVATNHSIFDPWLPWDRLYDVQENRTWWPRRFNPLADSLATLVPGGMAAEPEALEAGVLQGTDDLVWNQQNETCLKLEYRGRDLLAYTWVRKSDGLVLRQEAVYHKATPQEEHLTLERDPR